MLPAWRSTGAKCWGRPRRHLPAAQKCHRRDSRRWPHATRRWARARVPERTSGRSTLSWPSGTGAFDSQRSAPRQADPPRRSEERSASARQLYEGSDRPDSDSLQRRRSRGKSSESASTPSAPPMAEPSTAPLRLQSLLIRGGRAPDVHVSLVAGGAHDPSPAVLTVYFGTPSMFITLWFGFDYGTNPPLGTLII
jgi:hypothetical protein